MKMFGFVFALSLIVFSPLLARADTTDPRRPPAIQTQNVPVVPRALGERMRQYQNVRAASFAGWSPDGNGILISTRFGQTSQLHRVYVPGGRREQITFFDEPVSGTYIPHNSVGDLLLSMSAGGNEAYQIYWLDRSTGRANLLTDGNSRNLLGPIRHDGSRVVIGSTKRNGRDTDLYLADPRSPGSMQMLMPVSGEYWIAQDFSSDGTQLLINRYVSINESYPAVIDTSTGRRIEEKQIAIPDARHSYGAMAFSADGQSVLVAADLGGEFRQLYRCSFEAGRTIREPLTNHINWDVTSIEVAESGQVALTTNEDGASGLYLLGDGVLMEVDIPLGIVADIEFSPDGANLGFTLSRPNAPDDVYSINLQTQKLTRWTFSEIGGLDASKFIEPTRIAVESFDGLKVPAYYFRPKSATTDLPSPVLIHIHGGPESQYRPYFSGMDQFRLNELGIAIVRPNVRGSAGYGRSYLLLDNGPKREDSVRDIGAILDWIDQQPELDKNRVAVYGGSYGGYMVLGSLTNFPDRIKAGVDIVGIASFTTFLQNTSAYRRDLRRAEYGDERDPEMQRVFERINPANNAEKIKAALFVAHGKNDPRVPFSEAVQIVDKVQKTGSQVWTVYANNEGHGFRKKANRDYLYETISLFLKEQLVATDAE